MFEYIRRILSPDAEPVDPMDVSEVEKPGVEKRIQIATCALLIEIAKADGEFSEDERKKIIDLMKENFNLDEKVVEELIQLSEETLQHSISIYEFSNVINQNFTNDEKYELLKNLWKLIYVDDKLHMYEDYMIKKIGATLNMEHQLIIRAKLAVKEEMNK